MGFSESKWRGQQCEVRPDVSGSSYWSERNSDLRETSRVVVSELHVSRPVCGICREGGLEPLPTVPVLGSVRNRKTSSELFGLQLSQ